MAWPTGTLINGQSEGGGGGGITELYGDVEAIGPDQALATLSDDVIDNAKVQDGAAIAYAKLNLALSIVNADIAANAAIDASKIAGLSAAGIVAASITLNDTQIKALNSAAQVAVAAPGANIVNVPIGVIIVTTFTTPYDNNLTIRLRYNGDSTDQTNAINSVLSSASRTWLFTVANGNFTAKATAVNKALEISTASGQAGGNAANQLRCIVLYNQQTSLP